MSTHAKIIVTNESSAGLHGFEKVEFYRHADGYPSGVKPTLDTFCDWVKKGLIRKDDLSQSVGWLILLGFEENRKCLLKNDMITKEDAGKIEPIGDSYNRWKYGNYEILPSGVNFEVSYVYEVNMKTATWKQISEND